MTASSESMNAMFKRLKDQGYPKPFVKKVLPDWWAESASEDPALLYEAKLRLSKYFGLDFRSLLDDKSVLIFRSAGNCKFKTTQGTEECDRSHIESIARSIAELAAASIKTPFIGVPSSKEIRDTILKNGQPWVSFDNLLDYLWVKGIPVIHITNIPSSWRKMDGMVTMVNGRPVIILSRKELASSWQLFILAHEVGHILHGHIQDGDSLIDDKIVEDSADKEEIEANDEAIAIITEKSGTKIVPSARTWLKADHLAQAAKEYGEEHKIDPGHVVLNYGHTNKQMGAARSALKILYPGDNAIQTIRNMMKENLTSELVPEDSFHYLCYMCGILE